MEKDREMTNEEEEEREQIVKQMGCMSSFFHFFDRPHILSTSRRDRLSSSQSQMSGSVSPSERSEQSGPLVLPEKDSVKSRPPSPEPDKTRASLSVFKTASTWKLKEAPRLSLDSRLRPREIRTTVVDRVQEPDDQNRRSPSVVARLMGVDILPTASGPGSPAQLRRSNSESRVPRDSYRFMDSVPHNVSNNRRDQKADPGPGPGSRVSNAHLFHKKSTFEPVDCFPEPTMKKPNGEITLYGEIERRLRKRGMIDEPPSKDIETLKQVLEALQLKGLLHSQPLDRQSDGRRSFSDDHHHQLKSELKPPIVLMRPGSKPPRSPKNESGFNRRAGSGPSFGPKRDRIDMDRIVRRSSISNEMVKSPSSPGRRRNGGGHMESPKSPQRRISPVRVRVAPEPPLAVRMGRGRREAEDDTSTSVSGSSVATSPLDFERSRLDENSKSGRSLLDRCDKLLNSIVAFTSTDQENPQPSPVSVLDASILTEDSSPSPSSTRQLITPPKSPNPNICISEPLFDFDSSEDELSTVGLDLNDPDYFYIREFLHESSRYRDLSKAYDLLKKRHQSSPATWRHRVLIYDSVKDILERKRNVSPWDSFTSWMKPGKQSLLQYVWLEVQKIRDPTVGSCEMVDLNEATCKAIEKDLAADRRWENPSVELSDAVLQIERLMFKDLVADMIQELADVAIYTVPRRMLVF
ncbi:hypothetical protein LUZ60_004650 [Juncus effusus]|nr:hypothetical protein LUZ60_004650 [Juncus effusus]